MDISVNYFKNLYLWRFQCKLYFCNIKYINIIFIHILYLNRQKHSQFFSLLCTPSHTVKIN